MPEGGECRHITDILRSRLKDKQLFFINWLNDTKYTPYFKQTWPNIKHLFPTKCLDILCRGKQIFFFLENGLSFNSTLGTEGHWYYYKSNHKNRRPLDEYLNNYNYRKFSLHFGHEVVINDTIWEISDIEIHYADMLSYGNFTIGNWNDAFLKMKEIGPDLLAATTPILDIHSTVKRYLPPIFFEVATLENYITAIRNPRRSQMLLCVFLLKHQEYFSGVGNWVKCEVLYRSRLHPNRMLGSLSDQEIQILFLNCLTVISDGYKCGGLTHGTFLDPDGMKGMYKVMIYKREGLPDPNGFLIKRIKTKDGRSSYVVEELQR
jgi:formamidopyrimidine-DNA glycosylase